MDEKHSSHPEMSATALTSALEFGDHQAVPGLKYQMPCSFLHYCGKEKQIQRGGRLKIILGPGAISGCPQHECFLLHAVLVA